MPQTATAGAPALGLRQPETVEELRASAWLTRLKFCRRRRRPMAALWSGNIQDHRRSRSRIFFRSERKPIKQNGGRSRYVERIRHSEHGNCDGGVHCPYDLRRDAAALAAKSRSCSRTWSVLRRSQRVWTPRTCPRHFELPEMRRRLCLCKELNACRSKRTSAVMAARLSLPRHIATMLAQQVIALQTELHRPKPL